MCLKGTPFFVVESAAYSQHSLYAIERGGGYFFTSRWLPMNQVGIGRFAKKHGVWARQIQGREQCRMFIKVPMKIFDYRLSGNEMKVYLYLARIKNDSEIAMAKRETIRMRCGLRSNTTVGSILHVLEQKGLISKFHRYAANGYYISSMYLLKPLVGKWFAFYVDDMLPAVGGSEFLVYLYLFMLRRENGKAWPSLRKMERATGLARGTVCKAIRNLEKTALLLERKYERANITFTQSFSQRKKEKPASEPEAWPVPIFFVPLKIAQRRLRLQGGSNFDDQGLNFDFIT